MACVFVAFSVFSIRLKYCITMFLFYKRKHIKVQGKEGRDKLGVWSFIKYKIDKQPGPTVGHRELYAISCNNL